MEAPIVLVGVIIVLAAVLLFLKENARQTKYFSGVPGPKGHLLFGHLRDMLCSDYHRKLARWAAEYGPVFLVNVMGVRGLVISDPSVIATLLGQERGISAAPKLRAYQELDMVRLPVFLLPMIA